MKYISNAFSLSMLPEKSVVRVITISTSEARHWLGTGGFTSIVGHESTAAVFTQLLGIPVSMNRLQVKLEKGDNVIVGQINVRLPEGKILDEKELAELPVTWKIASVSSV